MTAPRITFTAHASTILTEREIDRGWIELTISDPEETEPDPNRANVVRVFRSIPEREGRVLRVVYSKSDDRIRVITAFFDRARRR
jgi:Domain of unknown function (DUF4258)